MRKARILIVEDDSTFRNLLVDTFHTEGYEAVSVMSGEDGIHELEEERFDLVIVDLNLAGWISGLGFLQEIKTLSPGMKIIVCSAQKDPSVIEEAQKLGGGEFIEKPIEELDRFLDVVKDTLMGVNNPIESNEEEA